MRALELCKLIKCVQSLNLALKYSVRCGNSSLSDKISEIIENETIAVNELEPVYSTIFGDSSSSNK
jgi:hypothetical protein